jgi:hypothetical protein
MMTKVAEFKLLALLADARSRCIAHVSSRQCDKLSSG